MTEPNIFKKDPRHVQAMASLSPRQRFVFIVFVIGAFFPIFFLGAIRPVYWIAAFQLGCVAALAYIRWRSPALRGSLVVVILAAVACIVSVVAGLAA